LFDEFNLQGGFFLGFPKGSGFQTLTIVDKTTGQCPALGKIFSLDQYDSASAKLDNDIHRGQRATIIFTHRSSLP
jgi:hypothetical protein